MESSSTLAMRELLQRRAGPKSADEAADHRRTDAAHEEEYTAFANGRIGTRTQLCVVFRLASGRSVAFSYAHLFSVDSDDPAHGCTISFLPATQVKISGRHLGLLFDGLCRHRAAEVVEVSRSATLGAFEGSVVDAIEVVQGRVAEQGLRVRPL